jgi:hypothetical protein
MSPVALLLLVVFVVVVMKTQRYREAGIFLVGVSTLVAFGYGVHRLQHGSEIAGAILMLGSIALALALFVVAKRVD